MNPEHEQWQEVLGLCEAGSFGPAFALGDQLTRQDRDPERWRNLGAALAARGNDQAAIEAYTRATWIIYKHADTFVAMAVSAVRLEWHDRARMCWKEALAVEPTLFSRRPELRVLWKECKRGAIPAAVASAAKRNDAMAALNVLEEIDDAADAADARAAVEAHRNWRQVPSLMAAHAASLLLDDVGVSVLAIDVAVSAAEQQKPLGEALHVKIVGWAASRLVDVGLVIDAARVSADPRWLRACWRTFTAPGDRLAMLAPLVRQLTASARRVPAVI